MCEATITAKLHVVNAQFFNLPKEFLVQTYLRDFLVLFPKNKIENRGMLNLDQMNCNGKL